MASNADYFLKKTLGEDFLESLVKVELWKPATKTTIDHEEIKTALQIVPRVIMAMLIRELSPMEIGETKEIILQVPGPHSLMRITKFERDVYSGEIEQDNKTLVDFKYRSIPGIGLVIMSAFELYDQDNLINSDIQENEQGTAVDSVEKLNRMIDERLALHDMIHKVIDKKMLEKDAVQQLILAKLSQANHELEESKRQVAEVRAIARTSVPMEDEYFRGMANGVEVANSIINKKEPNFVEAPKKKGSPVKDFLNSRKEKKNEYTIQMVKGESVSCPDCQTEIFKGEVFSGCICLGDDMERKLFIKKSEDGIKVRFSRGWDQENIEMLLETLRKKNHE